MAKIDTSKIEGFDTMSAEEKIQALTAFEFEAAPAQSGEADRLKAALSKANAEAADWKRQYKEKLTEAERAEAERKERERQKDEELESLRKERTISRLEAQYVSAGYSPLLAAETAKAFADGDTETVLKNQLSFIEETKKSLELAALGSQPKPSVGTPPAAQTKDEKIAAEAAKYAFAQ